MYTTRIRMNFSWREALSGWGGAILFFVLFLFFIGLMYIYSASYRPAKNTVSPYAQKQLKWALITMLPFIITIRINYAWLIRNAFMLYCFAIFLLIATFLVGTCHKGSQRWIKFGPILLQTSEIMKLVIIIVLARVLTTTHKTDTIMDLVLPFGIMFVPLLLIAKQPDLGTSLVLLPITCTMTYTSGVKPKIFIILLLVLMTGGILLYFFGLHEYQRKRVQMFIHQDHMSREEKRGSGYHLNQSKITHGDGGLWGRGYQKGSQNRSGFLPERHTDFIFAVIGEELGFFGSCIVIGSYLSLFLSMLFVAYSTLEPAGQLIIIGIVTLLSFQTVINTCMTVGLAPITGLPLPFLSYGGSSLMFNFISVGMVLSIAGHKMEA